jgi:hypothetical protein
LRITATFQQSDFFVADCRCSQISTKDEGLCVLKFPVRTAFRVLNRPCDESYSYLRQSSLSPQQKTQEEHHVCKNDSNNHQAWPDKGLR